MKKRNLAVLGGMVASVALVGSALPAQAFTPTISEVRYLPGPAESDWDDSWYDLALTPDASTAVFSTDSATFIVDVAANTATAIPGVSGGTYFLLDASGSYLYVVEGNDIFKVDMTSKTIVATWNDAAYDLSFDYLYFSADESSIFVLGRVGSFPNFAAAVAKVNLSTGAITQYESTNTGNYFGRAGYDATSGLMYIPTRDSATGSVRSLEVFDTAANTFTEIPWTDSGVPMDCDFQAGVLACVVEDTLVNYVATVDAAGEVASSVNVDDAVSNTDSVTLTPDGTRAYVFGDDGGLNNVEVIDVTTMSSVTVLNMLTDYQNVVRMAADAGQIWFTADYIRDYDGGYQVATFDPSTNPSGNNPQLADTGLDASTLTVMGVAIGAAGLLLLGFYVVRRRSVANAK
jgi:hypothetical protein